MFNNFEYKYLKYKKKYKKLLKKKLKQKGGVIFNYPENSLGDLKLEEMNSDIYCPNDKPYLCNTNSYSFGLCRKNIKDCNKIHTYYGNHIPMTKLAKEIKMGAHFGYVSDNLGKSCYPIEGKPNIDLNIKFKDGDIFPRNTNFSVMTYNIWGLYKKDPNESFMKKRMESIIDIFLKSNANIIFLQEVSYYSTKYLFEINDDDSELIKTKKNLLNCKYPYKSHKDGVPKREELYDKFNKNVDVFMLSNIKPNEITIYSIPGNLNYNNPIMKADFNNFTVFNIYTQAGSKFSPGQEDNWIHYARCRREYFQMLRILIDKTNNKNIITVGDFNCNLDGEIEDWPELKELIKIKFKDLWKEKGIGDGFTENTDKNLMRWNLKSKKKKFRYDAIFFKGSLRPINVSLVGLEKAFDLNQDESKKLMDKLVSKNIHTPGLSTVKFSDNQKFSYKKKLIGWWPSDHFGVIGKFQII